MIITRKWIHGVATDGYSGWNRDQLKLLGIKWPPRSGWLQDLIGTEISEERAQAVVEAKTVRFGFEPPMWHRQKRVS